MSRASKGMSQPYKGPTLKTYTKMAEDVLCVFRWGLAIPECDLKLFESLAYEKGHTLHTACRDHDFVVYAGERLKETYTITELSRIKKVLRVK